MRLDQLPPALQAQALKAAGVTRQPKDRTQDTGPGLPLTCTTCGFVVSPVTEGRLSKHARSCGGSRFDWRPA